MHALIVRFEGQNADFGGFGGGSFPQQQQQKTLVRLCPGILRHIYHRKL